MDEPSAGAVLEMLMVCAEAYCAGLTAKERLAYLRRVDAAFERRAAGEVVAQLLGSRTPAMVRADRAQAHAAFKDFLPRLMAP